MNQSNTVKVKVIGFNATSFGVRLNTVPSLPVWVNSKEEYKAYEKLIDQDAEFVRRNITTKAGIARTVYDLNRTKIDEADLDSLFTKSFAAAGNQDDGLPSGEDFEE